MKKTSFAQLSAAALLCCCGLATPSLARPVTLYEAVHWTTLNEELASVERTSDGGVIAAGTQIVSAGVSRIVLIKMNAAGVRQWIRYYSAPGAVGGRLKATSVRVASDGDYVIAGEIYINGLANQLLLMKVSPKLGDCTVRWSRTYAGTGFTNFGQTVVRELSGGGYAMIGRHTGGFSLMNGVLLTTDALGVQTSGCYWRDQRFLTDSFLSFNDIREEADGSLVVIGWTQRSDVGPVQAIALRTTNKNGCGPIRWAMAYDDPTPTTTCDEYRGEGVEIVPSVVEPTGVTFPGYYTMTGPFRQCTTPAGSFVFQLNPLNGALGWNFTTPNLFESQSIRTFPNQDTIINGQSGPNASRGTLARFDRNGLNVVARVMNNLPAGGTEFVHESIPMWDGTTEFVARVANYFGGIDAMTTKTNSLIAPTAGVVNTYCDLPLAVDHIPDHKAIPIQLVQTPMPPDQLIDILCTSPVMELNDTCFRTKPCTPKPAGMTLWLPFDEAVPAVAANTMNVAHPGTHVNGPAINAGNFVSNSLNFDGINDYVNVSTAIAYPGIEPATGSFTIDAWVRKTSVDSTVQVMVDHRREVGGPVLGYSYFLGAGNTQALQLADGIGAGFTNYAGSPATAVPGDGNWHHVAVVATRGGLAPTAQFYLDGVAVGPAINIAGRPGSLNTPVGTPFRVGSRSSSVSGLFRGGIDEVEFFRRALPPADIANLFNAGASGKCKNEAKAPVVNFCLPSDTSVSVTALVSNFTATTATYTCTFSPLPVGAGCSVAGPTSILPSTATVTVAPGTTAPVTVTMLRPAGLTYAGATSCFQFQATNTSSGETVSALGKLVDARYLCWPICCPLPIGVGPSGTNIGTAITNSSPTARSFPLRIRVIGPDMEPDLGDAIISLNGLPPGEPFIRSSAVLAPGDSEDITVNVQFDSPDDASVSSIIIEADVDGDGEWEPISSRFVQFAYEDPCLCVADFDASGGTPDAGDVDAFFTAWLNGDAAADSDCSGGTPDAGDIDEFFAQWLAGGC
jgi:hypothetical protein